MLSSGGLRRRSQQISKEQMKGQQIAIERVQCRVVNVRPQRAFPEVVEDDEAGRAPEAPESLFLQFGPDPAARLKPEQVHGLATVTERQYEQPGAAVLAGSRVAHHGAAALVDL